MARTTRVLRLHGSLYSGFQWQDRHDINHNQRNGYFSHGLAFPLVSKHYNKQGLLGLYRSEGLYSCCRLFVRFNTCYLPDGLSGWSNENRACVLSSALRTLRSAMLKSIALELSAEALGRTLCVYSIPSFPYLSENA